MIHPSLIQFALQLLTLLATLALFLLNGQLLLLLNAVLPELIALLEKNRWLNRQIQKAIPWLEKRKWIKNQFDLGQKFGLALVLGPFQVQVYAVLVCLWFGRQEAAYLWAASPWLYLLGLCLAFRLLRPRRSAPLGDGPVIVTDENCAALGLTPEKAREMTATLVEQTRRSAQLAADPEPGSIEAIYAEYGMTDELIMEMTGRLMERAKQCPEADDELDPDICAEYGMTPERVLEMTERLMERNKPAAQPYSEREVEICAEFGLNPDLVRELAARLMERGSQGGNEPDPDLCAEYGLTPRGVLELMRRLKDNGDNQTRP